MLYYRKDETIAALAEYLMNEAIIDGCECSEDIEDWKELAEAILKEVHTLQI